MRAIITGADGFVGSAIVKELLENGWDVVAVDLAPSPKRLPSHYHLVYFSSAERGIPDVCAMLAKYGPFDVFYHLAWRGVSGDDRGNEEVQLQNALLATQWLRAAKELGCTKFISSGSIMEFETWRVVYEQETKPSLGYIYGAAKTAAHEMCKSLANQLGIHLVWAYITNTYGVGEASPRMLNTTLRKIIHHEPLEFTEAKQNYDFIYISDVAYAFRLLGEKGEANKNYVIGSGEAKPLRLFLEDLLDELAPGMPAVFGAIAYTGVQTPLEDFDISEIKQDCDFLPKVSFAEGVRRTFEWLRSTEGDAVKR
jgi:UDP-glucose 4-epimerase